MSLNFNDFWQAAKKMKLTGNDFDNPRSHAQFTRAVRPMVLFASVFCLFGVVESSYQQYENSKKQKAEIEEKIQNNIKLTEEEEILKYKFKVAGGDSFMDIYGIVKHKWLKKYYQYLDIYPLENSDYQQYINQNTQNNEQ